MYKRNNKGTAGLTILLSIVTMLFVIGLIVMIFAIMSGQMANTDTLYSTSASIPVTNEAVTQALLLTAGGDALTVKTLRDASCTIVAVYNNSITGAVISSGNYTEVTECALKNTTSAYSTVNWVVNYTYTYSYDRSGAVGVINDTSSSISGVTDWFDIIVVIGAMVVLILLTVLIITAIRGSGMIGGVQSGQRNVGTA